MRSSGNTDRLVDLGDDKRLWTKALGFKTDQLWSIDTNGLVKTYQNLLYPKAPSPTLIFVNTNLAPPHA